MTGQPFAIAVIVLFGIVLARAQATYWIARMAAAGTLRSRWAKLLTGPRVAKATNAINRWGPPVVTVSFLTIGFQTIANAAAGLTRMPFPRYLVAMIPGCVAWAFMYAALAEGTLFLAREMPWVLVAVAVVIGVVIAVVTRRRRSAAAVPADIGSAQD